MSTKPVGYVPTTDLNLNGLIEAVAAETGTSVTEARLFVQATLDVVARAVSNGHSITVSNFGTWSLRVRKAHRGRDPQSGELLTVPERMHPTFKFTGRMLDSVHAGEPVDTVRKAPKSY